MTAPATRTPGAILLRTWERCRRLPFGDTIFGWLLARAVPYSSSIGARVLELSPGHARLSLADRRAVRNHLNSIHAVALTNLGELTSGLAMLTALPPGARAIVTGLEVEFTKKARGTIVATSEANLPPMGAEADVLARAELRDAANDVVARIAVRWRIGPA